MTGRPSAGWGRLPVRSIALIVATVVALYGFVLFRGESGDFARALGGMRPGVWGQVIALSCLSYLARFYRWHRFLTALGHSVPVLADLRIYLAGFALTLTPAKAGETIRSLYLRPLGVPVPDSLAVFVCERLVDLLVVGGISCLALRAFPAYAWMGLVGLGCCVLFALCLRFLAVPALVGRLFGKSLGAHLEQAAQPMRMLLAPKRLAAALPPSLTAWLAQGLSLYLVVGALGSPVDPGSVIGIYCVAILAGALSFLPGGLGATEGAIVFLLISTGIPAADAVVASLLARGLTLWLAVAIGLGATAMLAAAAPASNAG